MKRFAAVFSLLLLLTACIGCQASIPQAQVIATTLPVYDLTQRLCENTDISVARLVTENVSCLHDYTLSVPQAKAVETCDLVILSGGGLEDFMADILDQKENVLDSSENLSLTHCEEKDHEGHDHAHDPHFWLSPVHAKGMAQNIHRGLVARYPAHKQALDANLQGLLSALDALEAYGKAQLADLTCRELICFHDGFSYFAESFDLTILSAIEEESGSEASAEELKELVTLVQQHRLPAIFTEHSGSVSAANIIAAETGVQIYALDMAMAGNDYFEAMYHNIDTVKEALG